MNNLGPKIDPWIWTQFRSPIALRTDLSHITTALWEIPVLRMAH